MPHLTWYLLVSKTNFQLILNHSIKVGRRSGFTVTDMGARRANGETTIHDGLCCYIDFNPGKYMTGRDGQFALYQYIVFAEANADLQPGDMIYPVTFLNGMTIGRILSVGVIPDFTGMTHHVEALVEKA